MAKEKICGIYCIENLINGKRYIGQSVNIYDRWKQHRSELRRDRHANYLLQEDWNKYGEDIFKFYVIVECEIPELDKYEIDYIGKFQSCRYGYNIEPGGAVRQAPMTEEQKIQRRVKNIDAHLFESDPILQIDFNGIIVGDWTSARCAARELNYNQSCIWNCLNGIRLTYKQCVWIYKSLYDDNFDISNYINQNTQPREIDQYTEDDVFMKRWSSANAAEVDGFDSSSVIKCCKGIYKTHHGCKFKYTY